MFDGDWPHQGPLQNNTRVLATEKSQRPSILIAPNFCSRISAISKGSAPDSGFNNVQGIFTEPGIVPFLTQSGVRESITSMELSPLD